MNTFYKSKDDNTKQRLHFEMLSLNHLIIIYLERIKILTDNSRHHNNMPSQLHITTLLF